MRGAPPRVSVVAIERLVAARNFPTGEKDHLGLGVLVGGNAGLDLRLLGWGVAIPLAPLEKLFPVMWIGVWVNAISGVALLLALRRTVVIYWGRMLPFIGNAF